MKKALILAIIAIFICSSVWAGKTIMNAPGGKRTSAQLTNTMAFPLDSGTSDYWTDLAEHYAWVKAQMDVLYASKPWYDGAANSGSLLKLYGPTVANGGHGTWTALQGADYVGTEGTGMTWRLPISAYPSAGTTSLLNVDEYGQMGLLSSTTYAAASHNQAYTTLTGVTGASKYLGTDAGGTYGIFDLPSGGSMTWPSAGGIPLYSGSSSWGTSLSSSTALHYLRRNATNDGYEFGALPSFLASADIDTSSELRAILSDESGTGALIFADGALGTPSFTAFNLPTSDASPGATIGQMKHDSVTTGLAGGAVAWYDGAAVVRYLVDLDTLPTNDDYVVAYDADADKFYMKSDATGAGYTNLTSFIEQTAWRLFYSDGSGDVKELALGADGEYLKSNGAAVAPSWATPSGAAHDAVTLSTDLGNNLLGLSTQQLTLDTQTANTVLAGPATGEAVAPTFRALVAADIPSLTGTYAAIAGTPSTTFQIDNDATGPLLKWDSGNTQLSVRNAADDAYYDFRVKNLYVENINSTKADGEYFANFDNTVAITFTPALGDIYSRTTTGTSVLYFYDGAASRVILNDNSTIDDDKVSFDDADNLWTATTIGAALEELNDSINAGAPNGTGAKVHWSQLLGVPSLQAALTNPVTGPASPTAGNLTKWGPSGQALVDGPALPSGTLVGTSDTQTLSAKTLTAPKETVVAGGTCSTSYAPDLAAGSIFSLTLNGACEISNPSNLAAGQSFVIRLTQSSTTAPTWGTNFKWPAGTAPTWSTSATKYDLVSCVSVDGTTLSCGGLIDVR